MNVQSLARGKVHRVVALTIAAVGIAVLALALGHGDGNRVLATGDGDFTATLMIAVEGLDPFECTITGSLVGGSERVSGKEAYDVTDELVDTTGICPLDESTQEDDLTQTINGTVLGVVSEIDPNGNDFVDGLAEGRFEIQIVADTTSLGVVHTGEEEPIVIACPEIDLGDGSADARVAYTCDQVLDAEHPPVPLYGDGPMATIESMTVDFTGVTVPRDGTGGDDDGDSGVDVWLIILIVVVVIVVLAAVGAFGFRATRRGRSPE